MAVMTSKEFIKKLKWLVNDVPNVYHSGKGWSERNSKGQVQFDCVLSVKCILWNCIAETCHEYCKKGDIVGVKGRIQTTVKETESGEKDYSMDIVAEKVSFLSSGRKEQED